MALNDEQFERLKYLTTQQFESGNQVPTGSEGISFMEDFRGDVRETGQGIAESFRERSEKIGPLEKGSLRNIGPELRQTARGIGHGAGFVSDIIGQTALGVGKAILPQRAEDVISGGVQKVVQTDPVQAMLRGVENFKTKHPELSKDIDAAFGPVMLGVDITGLSVGGKALKKGVEIAGELPKKTIGKIGTPQVIQDYQKSLKPKSQEEAINVLVNSYKTSFVEDSVTINKKLDKQSRKLSKYSGENITNDDLIRNLAINGYLPRVEGKLAKFDDVISDIEARQARLMEEINPVLETIPEITKLDSLVAPARQVLKDSPQTRVNLKQANAELDRFVENYRSSFGDDLNARQVNEIIVSMNQRTKAFSEDVFKQDAADAFADAARARLDELVPSGNIRNAKDQYGALEEIKKTAQIFDNKPINIGVFGGVLGRYLGVIGLGTVGFSTSGPGGLVVAGLAAQMGGDVLAQFLRNKKFSGAVRDQFIDSIRRDDEVVRQLIDEASQANKATLERLLLPEGPIIAPPPQGASQVKAVQAGKGVPGRKRGRFIKTYSSTGENLN